MIIFIAGATGAVGGRLVPMLLEQGHEVVATTRTPEKAAALRELGAMPVVVDALDRDAVFGAVTGAEPDVIVHQMTALSGDPDMKHFDRMFAQTNRLRTEGTRNLLDAGAQAGVRRFIAQSFTGWPFAREGGPVKGEDAPLDPSPPAAQREPTRYPKRIRLYAIGIDSEDKPTMRATVNFLEVNGAIDPALLTPPY